MNAETRIKDALRRFEAAVSSADGEALASSLRELDELAREHRGRLDPRLQHFLDRRSYEKASEWLAGET